MGGCQSKGSDASPFKPEKSAAKKKASDAVELLAGDTFSGAPTRIDANGNVTTLDEPEPEPEPEPVGGQEHGRANYGSIEDDGEHYAPMASAGDTYENVTTTGNNKLDLFTLDPKDSATGIGITIEESGSKVKVSEVAEDSVASSTSIKVGDTVVNINGKKVKASDLTTYQDLLSQMDEPVKLLIEHANEDIALFTASGAHNSEVSAKLAYIPTYADPSHQAQTKDNTAMELITLDPNDSPTGIGIVVGADEQGPTVQADDIYSNEDVYGPVLTKGVMIVEIIEGGVASSSASVKVGDRLINVGGIKCTSGQLASIQEKLSQMVSPVKMLLAHGKTLARKQSVKRLMKEEVYENVQAPEEEAPVVDPFTKTPEIRVRWGQNTVDIVVVGEEEEDAIIYYTTDGSEPEILGGLIWNSATTLEIPSVAAYPGQVFLVAAIAKVESKKVSRQSHFARALDDVPVLPAPKLSFNHTLQQVQMNGMIGGAEVYYSHTEAPSVFGSSVTGGTLYDATTPVKPFNSPGDNDIWAISIKDGHSESKVTRMTYEVHQSPDPKVWYAVGIATLLTKNDKEPRAEIFYSWEAPPAIGVNALGKRLPEGATEICKSGHTIKVDTTVAGVKKLHVATVYPDKVPSNVVVLDITIAQVPAPSFDYDSGEVSITSDYAGSVIYYSIGGAEPLVSLSNIPGNAGTIKYVHGEPIVIDSTRVGSQAIKAIAVVIGELHSEVAHLAVDLEKIEPPELVYNGKSITIKSPTAGASVLFGMEATPLTAERTEVSIAHGGKHMLKAIAVRPGMVTSEEVDIAIEIEQTPAPSVECVDGVTVIESFGTVFYKWNGTPSTPAAGEESLPAGLADGTEIYHENERIVMEPGEDILHCVAVESGKMLSHVVTVTCGGATRKAMVRELTNVKALVIPVSVTLTAAPEKKKQMIPQVEAPQVVQDGALLKLTCSTEGALIVYDWTEGMPKMPGSFSGPATGTTVDMPYPPDGDAVWYTAVKPGMLKANVGTHTINKGALKSVHDALAAKVAAAAKAIADAEAVAAKEIAEAEAAAAKEAAEVAATARKAAEEAAIREAFANPTAAEQEATKKIQAAFRRHSVKKKTPLTKEERKAQRAALFKEIDADGDGKISLKEAMAFGMTEETFKSIDANGDGNLSKKEIAKWLTAEIVREEAAEEEAAEVAAAAHKAAEEAAIREAFANPTEAEQEATKRIQAVFRGHSVRKRTPATKEERKTKRTALFKEIDADGDGKISLREATAFGMTEETFKSIDANGDGNLSKKEIAEWLKAEIAREEAAEEAAAEPKVAAAPVVEEEISGFGVEEPAAEPEPAQNEEPASEPAAEPEAVAAPEPSAEPEVAAAPEPAPAAVGKKVTKKDVGKRVQVEGVECEGVLRFFGPNHETGKNRCGVELDEPMGVGTGTLKGHEYFTCKKKHAKFGPPSKVLLVAGGDEPIAAPPAAKKKKKKAPATETPAAAAPDAAAEGGPYAGMGRLALIKLCKTRNIEYEAVKKDVDGLKALLIASD
jgi:Ca2+-binding EF-hand superfamily protein/membrane-associated protease RseP (regulator of RpoE activity)